MTGEGGVAWPKAAASAAFQLPGLPLLSVLSSEAPYTVLAVLLPAVLIITTSD